MYCGRTRKIISNLWYQRPTITCRVFVSRGIPLLIEILRLSFLLINILIEITTGLWISFSSTRVFWSTQDIRKRCVYTCQIVEVKPDSPKSAAMLIKDITIIHDETHPDYVPLSQINIPGINLFPDSRPRTRSLELSGLSEESGFSKSFDTSGDCEILNSTLNSNQSFSASDVGNDSLSSSWPVVKKRKTSDPAVNLGVLSPNTLRLLNLKDRSKAPSCFEMLIFISCHKFL